MTFYNNISDQANDIIEKKEVLWEYRLFAQILDDEMKDCEYLKRDIEYDLDGGRAYLIEDIHNLREWSLKKTDVLLSISSSLEKLINDGLNDALVETNEEKEIEKLIYLAKRILDQYRRAINWKMDFNGVKANQDFAKMLELYSHMADDIIREVERFEADVKAQVEELFNLIKSNPKNASKKTIKIAMDITVPDLSEISAEIERLSKVYG